MTEPIVVDIGAALKALQDNPDIAGQLNMALAGVETIEIE